MYRKLVPVFVITAMMACFPAYALTATQTVEREVVIKKADGSEITKREPADMVVPGEKVIYSLKFFNDKDAPAENIVLVMPIPKEVSYIEGSADNKLALTEYSADGGKTFFARESLKVKTKDGKLVAAKAEDISHIRWKITKPIAPKASGVLAYAGKLK